MFDWLKREKDNPILPDRSIDVINFKYDLDLIKGFLERIKNFIIENNIQKLKFYDQELSFKQMESKISKELLYDRPCFMFELYEFNLEIMINANICRHPDDSTFIVTCEHEAASKYMDEILKPQGYISRFVNNAYFHHRQNDHQIHFFEDTRYLNTYIYQGYDPKTETIDKTLNAGYLIYLNKFGSFGVSQYNEYGIELLDAISKDKVMSALKQLKVQYTLDNEYLKFKLFENHRESEYIKNYRVLKQFGNLIARNEFMETINREDFDDL